MTNEELILYAEGALRPVRSHDGRLHGDVAAALCSKSGRLFRGVCIDTASWGLCAERSALAAMITSGEYGFESIVAVWRDPETKKLHALPPCGHCREFMRQIDRENLNSKIVLGRDISVPLRELIPFHEWPDPID